MAKLPTLFIPHGGGPCFFMDPMPGFPPDLWDGTARYLRGIDAALGTRPKAVLVVSGHWEAPVPTVSTAERHTLLFDYYGFPEHTYRLTYPAAGSAALSHRVRELLNGAGMECAEDAARGLDHGVFVPFKLIYPKADVPIVALSLTEDLDAARHLDMGRALAPLREEGVLIVGSGMSYHNLRRMMSADAASIDAARQFDEWLQQAAAEPARLADWRNAPGARAAHPREEHLIPLMVAAGAGLGAPGVCVYSEPLFGKPVSAFQFS